MAECEKVKCITIPVQQLLVRGYSQWDVAEEQQIDQSTVSRCSLSDKMPKRIFKTYPTKTS